MISIMTCMGTTSRTKTRSEVTSKSATGASRTPTVKANTVHRLDPVCTTKSVKMQTTSTSKGLKRKDVRTTVAERTPIPPQMKEQLTPTRKATIMLILSMICDTTRMLLVIVLLTTDLRIVHEAAPGMITSCSDLLTFDSQHAAYLSIRLTLIQNLTLNKED